MKKKKLLSDSTSGQSLVELSVSLVILLFLLAGAVEFGILFFQYVQLRDAAQEGAMYGSIHPTDQAAIITRVNGSSGSPLDLKGLYDAGMLGIAVKAKVGNTTTDKALADACEGDGLEITVTYTHKMFMPFLSGREIPLAAKVTDTILTPVCP